MSQVGQFVFEEVVETLTGNTGDICHPQVGNINIVGSGHLSVNGNNTTATLTIASDGGLSDTFTTDSGAATPSAGNINVFGGDNINTAGAGSTVTINLDESIVLPVTNATGTEGLYSLGSNRFMHGRGTANTFLGESAGSLSLTVLTGINNVGIGINSLTAITSANHNTACGDNSQAANLTASYNTSLGSSSLATMTSGVANTAIGTLAGSLLNGNGNTLLGKEAGISYVGTESYNICIGASGTAAESNKIRIGTYGSGSGQQDTAYIAGIVHASNGLVADAGDIKCTAGDIIADAGDISATLGFISAENENIYIGNRKVDITGHDLQFEKSRLGAVITSGDTLGNIKFSGYDGSNFNVSSVITSRSSGTIGAGRVAADLEFWTSPDAASIALRRLDIKPTGELYLYSPDSGTGFTIAGRGQTIDSGDLLLSSGNITLANLASATTQPYLILEKSRASGVITTGDILGEIDFKGHDGTSFITGSYIKSVSSGTIATNRVASDLEFYTHPDSTTASTQRVVINSAGSVTINSPDAGDALTVTGGLTVTGIAGVTTTNTKIVTVNSSTGQVGAVTTIPAANGGSLAWTEVTGTTQSAAVMNGYITNNAALVTVTLPSSASVGERVAIVGKGAGLWKLAQNAGQTVHFGSLDTTTGATGYISATVRYDCLEVICTTANTDWVVRSSVGELTIA